MAGYYNRQVNTRVPDRTKFLELQCLNDLRVRIYDSGTLTTWLYRSSSEKKKEM